MIVVKVRFYSLFALCLYPLVNCDGTGYDYTPAKDNNVEVEIQKVEVYEVPWIGDQSVPENSYKPTVSNKYGPPPNVAFTTTSSDTVEPTTPATTNSTSIVNSTQTDQTAKLEDFENDSGINNRGHYYIYHPAGLLQKVTYSTNDDAAKMAYSVKLKYQNVDPIREPIYTYEPGSYVFSRINRK